MIYSFDNSLYKDFMVLKSQIISGNNLDFEKVEASQINFDKKSIVILCGNNSKSLRRAEYYSYLCRGWLRDHSQNVSLSTYAIYYPNQQPLFNEDPYFKLDYRGLAEDIFGKVIYKGCQVQSVDEIKRKLSKVVFFGHSAGGYVMNELMKCFAEMLHRIKLSREETREVFESMVFIGYAPYNMVAAPIKSIYITPVYDTMGSAKLAYKYMLKSDNVVSSRPDLDFFGANKLNTRMNVNFMRQYKEFMRGENTLYFANKNSLVATPNLLYYDGRKEDHNFAGVINYNTRNPYQTKAGRLTTKFMNITFDYCVSTKREKFDINDLYRQALRLKLSEKELNTEL